MCVAIIGYCDCLDCCGDPAVGKLQRVDFCVERQKELGDVWSRWTPVEKSLIPCDNLAFIRQKDANACRFANKKKSSSVENTDPTAVAAALSGACSVPATAKLSACSTGHVLEQPKDGNNGSTDPIAASSKTTDKEPAEDTLAFKPINKPRKKLPNSRPPLSEARLRAAAAAALAVSYPNGGAPPSKSATPALESANEKMDDWTKEEVMKLLLCRSKDMGFDDISRNVLPGHDADECIEKLASMGRKHGFESLV
ncbi:hypothetical protein MFIFM68171_06503 [Madurella fahalii]|uniref:Uncharacterized protein n=1 Tax=Madurella fahalii TaxID=1157608 RepID=A0ABQ0GEV5_9PEZI